MTSAELRYLISISELSVGENGVKLTAIAVKMKVSKVSVFRVAERLEKGGYVRRDEKNRVVMTGYGYEQLLQYRLMIGLLGNHLEYHCGVPGNVVYRDTIGAACAMSDQSRHGLTEFIKSQKALIRTKE